MFSLLALLLVWLPLRGDTPPHADPERVKSALAELEKAWKSDSAAERVRALQTQGSVPDPAVVKLVARGLREKEPEVQRAAIEALRWAAHPDALKELQTLARDEKPLRKDPALYAGLLRAVGQYGSPTSLRLFADDAWSIQDARVLQARLLGLGRIRTRESVEKLVELLKSAGPQRIQPVMPDVRLALAYGTGADLGNSAESWLAWWNENRSALKIDDHLPELPRDLARKWKTYWGEEPDDDRPRKRAERGRDDPRR